MKKVKKIVFWIAVILLFAVLAVCAYLLIFHLNDIKALYGGLTSSSSEIEQKMQKNEEELRDTINNHGFSLSDSDVKKLNGGGLSEKEITDILLGKKIGEENSDSVDTDVNNDDINGTDNVIGTEVQDGELVKNGTYPNANDKKVTGTLKAISDTASWKAEISAKKPTVVQTEQIEKAETAQGNKITIQGPVAATKPPAQTQTDVSGADKRTAELVAKMYVLKSQFSGQISGIVESMKAEYAALPASRRTASAKSSIASSYMNKISALEAQCDAQVDAVVSELRTVLKANGGDMSLADSIMSAYAVEKETTKAYYVNKYSK